MFNFYIKEFIRIKSGQHLGKSLLGFILVWVLAGCQQTQTITYDLSIINILVKDDLGKPVSGAIVRMYDDVNNYTSALSTGNDANFVSKTITDTTGKTFFTNLNTQKNYYFLVTYKDRARFSDLDNSGQQYEFSKYLVKGSTTFAEINLKPAKSVFSFYAGTQIQSHIPIKIFINNDSIGTINTTVSTAPTLNTTNGPLQYRLSQGTNNWYAKSALGCIWTGSLQVTGAENFTPIALSACNAGSVSFYVDSANTSNLPIKVTLNQNDVLGTLTNYLATSPGKCFAVGSVTAARDTGSYTYTAESLNSSCVWSGTVKISFNCNVIYLPKCN